MIYQFVARSDGVSTANARVRTPAKKGVSVYTRPESVFAVSGAERIDVVINPVYAYVETQIDRVDVYRAPLKTAA